MPHTLLLDESDIAATARRFGGALLALGLKKGDCVAAMASGPDGEGVAPFVAARDAAAALGLYFAPVDADLALPEVAYLVARSRTKVLLVGGGSATHVLSTSRWPRVMTYGELDRLAYKAELGPAKPRALVGATVLLTSGTTGPAQLCLYTAEQESRRAAELLGTYGINAADVHLVSSSLAHSVPDLFVRACRAVGASTVVLPQVNAEDFLAAVARHRATLFVLGPKQVERLLALPDTVRARADWSSVRAVIVAGAPFGRDPRRRFREWIGSGKLRELDGAAEGTTSYPAEVERAHAAVG